MSIIRLRKFGDSVALTLSKDLRVRMGLQIGDTVSLVETESGWRIIPPRSELELQMTIAREIVTSYRDALGALAK